MLKHYDEAGAQQSESCFCPSHGGSIQLIQINPIDGKRAMMEGAKGDMIAHRVNFFYETERNASLATAGDLLQEFVIGTERRSDPGVHLPHCLFCCSASREHGEIRNVE